MVGLVLHLLRYEDRGTLRPVLYRVSLAEMFIPYGDPNPAHYRKNVFDMGEYGIGVLANSLELGCDCLGEIRHFDAWLNDNDGHAPGQPARQRVGGPADPAGQGIAGAAAGRRTDRSLLADHQPE